VIIATYNWSGALRYAIRSVLWQTLQDFELLVVGDACTDDSEQVVSSFNDDRVHWHNLSHNSGNQSGPNNKGLELARGRYVAYLGHDDVWYPSHLATLVDTLERTNADLAFTLSELVGPPGSGLWSINGFPTETVGDVHPPPSSIMHRTALGQEIGPWKHYSELFISPDAEFYIRAWDHGKQFVLAPELTVVKFLAAARPGVYLNPVMGEQESAVKRIAGETDFRYRELLNILKSVAAGKPRVFWQRSSLLRRVTRLFEPPGLRIERTRVRKGLPIRLSRGPGLHYALEHIRWDLKERAWRRALAKQIRKQFNELLTSGRGP
jgi:glycosyltransferase involved in cell wall biosynthesis